MHSDSDDDFVVKEQKVQDDDKKKFRELNDDEFRKPGGEDESNEEHGALVKKILESKEQLEYGSELNRQKDFVAFLFFETIFCLCSKSQNEKKPMMQNDAQRKKDRERIQQEIEKLKESIQTLTKS